MSGASDPTVTHWLAAAHTELAEAVAQRLSARPGSVFRSLGEAACRTLVEAALTALQRDLTAGNSEALRAAVLALVDALTTAASTTSLSFADLRLYAQSLRNAVLARAPADARPSLDAWFFELVMVYAMRFVGHREEAMQQKAARLEIGHLTAQLDELQAALAEKTELLDRIRQTSTPIAPVVEGILVVPLVGMFDTFRAELLTERLLHEISRARAVVVILDISGVPVFDAQAVALILRLAQAVRLLGTELVLVGVSPTTAQTIVDLDVDLAGLRALGSLQDGLALALKLRRLQIKAL